jgi:serine/threonine protein kinase
MNQSTNQASQSLIDFAKEFGENNIASAESYKTRVFIGDKHVFKFPEHGAEGSKEEVVLKILNEKLPEKWRSVVSQVVKSKDIEDIGLIQVQTKLVGTHSKLVSTKLAQDLGQFLSSLHGMATWEKITEFEGKEDISFNEYLRIAPEKFLAKLDEYIDTDDKNLILKAIAFIQSYLSTSPAEPEMVLVHKDISLDNLLTTSDGGLSGIIDWGASQTAPKEWEFSIIKQRMPESFDAIMLAYGKTEVNQQLFKICGLVQSIRFWKSFPGDQLFASQQRNYIKSLLAD